MSCLTSSDATKRSYFLYPLMVLGFLNTNFGMMWLESKNPYLGAHLFRKMVERQTSVFIKYPLYIKYVVHSFAHTM